MADLYPVVKDLFDGIENYKCDSNLAINQGALVQWDASNRKAIEMTAAGGVFLGVCLDSNPFRGLTELTLTEIRVQGQGVHRFKTTASETYVHKTPVAMGADSQTVTTVVGGKTIIGEVWAPDGSSTTGAAGTNIKVNLFGAMAGVPVPGMTPLEQTVAATAAGTDAEYPLFVAPYPLTVVKAGLTFAAAVAAGTGNTYFIAQIRNKGTDGSGTTVLATVNGAGTAYSANLEKDMGTIANADVAAGEVLALFIDQQNPGAVSPVGLVNLRTVRKI